MILSGLGKRDFFDLNKWERREIRQKNLQIAANLQGDHRSRSRRMADARVQWDAFLVKLRREKIQRVTIA